MKSEHQVVFEGERVESYDQRPPLACHEETRSAVLSAPSSSHSPFTIHHSLCLLRLFQLVSPALPVGAYHFSQGLEYAVHAEWVRNEDEAGAWIHGIAKHSIGTLDLPLLLLMLDGWHRSASDDVARWSRILIASRETSELRAEERHVGKALAKVLLELGIDAQAWTSRDDTTYAAMFALAAAHWNIDGSAAAQAYLWAWCENQVLAALKLLPIGQSAGQRMLNRLLPEIPRIAEAAAMLEEECIGVSTPAHGIASSRHETQYSRLFKS